jgi:hypothetical protein
MRDQVSHPYKTMVENMVLYILNFILLERKWELKRLGRKQ